MDLIDENNLTKNQKNLLDLKIRLIKAEYELNFYLTGYENLSQFYDDKEKLDRIFVDSYVSLRDHNLYDFVEKIDRIKESDFSYKTDDRKIQNFLKSLEDIKNLDDDEIIKQKGRIKNRIRKMEMATSEIEYVLLGSLPKIIIVRVYMAIKYDIVENLGVLSTNAKGWTKELNLVSWNDRDPKYDLRDWNEDHTRMSKGITLQRKKLKFKRNFKRRI
ncbi:MAG: YdbC family protein [Anaerococcus obesiensis]